MAVPEPHAPLVDEEEGNGGGHVSSTASEETAPPTILVTHTHQQQQHTTQHQHQHQPPPPPPHDECVICLDTLAETAKIKKLPCNHLFHVECIEEWIKKDGRCPVCRHVVDEVAAAAAQANDRSLDLVGPLRPGDFTVTGMLSMLAESRRLMMLATMQAALSVFVLSHNADLVSPALMLLSASLLFNASSHFLTRTLSVCRMLLLANIGYHIWMVLLLVDLPSDDDFFSDQNTAVRADVITFMIVVVLEVFTLKKLSIFCEALGALSAEQLGSLRRLRRAQQSVQHGLLIRLMFILICLPVLAKYMCWLGALEGPACESAEYLRYNVSGYGNSSSVTLGSLELLRPY